MSNELEILLEKISSHFTPAEFVDSLGISWEELFSSDLVIESIEKNVNYIKEIVE